MKYVFAFSLLIVALIWMAAPSRSAGQDVDDRAAVERAVLDYVEALYDAEPSRIARSVDSGLVKFGLYRDSEGRYKPATMSYEQLVELSGRWNAGNRQNITGETVKEVIILDVLDRTAVAKLVAKWGIDYFHLAKQDGVWQILHVLWQSHPLATETGSLSLTDFQRFRQFEGDWRGSAPDGKHFFERYAFADDSTMQMTYFTDSTMTTASGHATIVLRNGHIYHDSGKARWGMNAADMERLHFVPVRNAGNTFSWSEVLADEWTATLTQRVPGDSERTTLYRMERWAP